MRVYNISLYDKKGHLNDSVIQFKDNGRGLPCLNPMCSESSLSVQWMVDFTKNTQGDLFCFQCDNRIARWFETKKIEVKNNE
tara:strand:+ start:580 stop:825 length:246 start_codon:yes stop_codon:yes gene_type:complete